MGQKEYMYIKYIMYISILFGLGDNVGEDREPGCLREGCGG